MRGQIFCPLIQQQVMKIKLLGELCALLILTSACHHENVTGRLAENYDSDWGVEATNLHLIDMESASSLIAVIDTGCNIVSSSVLDGYNIIEHSSNVTDQLLHGTIIISKLLELCPNSKILPIKVADSNESIKPDDLVKGVEKAIDLKANIINISLSTIDPNPKLEAVIDKAIKQNICVIAAAGNQGLDRLPYPAAYPNVISVMARDINNRDVNFNNKSSEKNRFPHQATIFYVMEHI